MKPEPSRELKRNTGIARAKMLLKAHLAWLDGCPSAQTPGQVHWRTRPQQGSPEGTQIVVDRELLKRSQAALTKLLHQFPRALPTLVGDVQAWSQSVSATLDRLKQAVHADADLLSDDAWPVETLSRSESILVQQLSQAASLRPLLRFIIWSGCFEPKAREFLLPWLARQACWVPEFLRQADATDGLACLLVAGDLARSDGDDFQTLLNATIALTNHYATTTMGLSEKVARFARQLRDWRKSEAMPPTVHLSDAVPYGVRVVAFINWLAQQNRSIRLRATRLANQILSASLLQDWDAAWERYQRLTRRAIRELCGLAKHKKSVVFHAEACRVSQELEYQFREMPLTFPVIDILSSVRGIALRQPVRLNHCLCGILASIPIEMHDGSLNTSGLAMRLALLREADSSPATSVEIRYYELFQKYLQSGTDPVRMRPWLGLIQPQENDKQRYPSPRSSVCEQLGQPSRLPEYFQLLKRVVGDSAYRTTLNDELAWLLSSSESVDQAVSRFRELAPTGLLHASNESQIHAAIELAAGRFSLTEMLKLVGSESRFEYLDLKHLRKLHQLFVQTGWGELIPTLLQMGQGAELQRAVENFEKGNGSNNLTIRRRIVLAALPSWAAGLPEALQSSISTLLGTFPESGLRIRRILGKHFPDPEALRAEIAVLRQLDGQPTPDAVGSSGVPVAIKRQRRLTNLTHRLENPQPVSKIIIDRLCHELDQVLMMEVLRDTTAQLQNGVMALFTGGTDQCQFDYQALPTSHTKLIQGVLELGEPYRTYALRLLRQQWYGIEWNLLQEPANQHFQQGITSRGISLEPWLSDRVQHVPATEEHPEFTLSFESRPVEKLLMGYYFDTCLSPDGCNFFSAVVNAIDINKRILYGRDGKGDVIGRCLFAIGDADTVVAFRPYSHGAKLQFEEHVQQFANELANEMGTVVSHSDHVSAVVGPRWYDDGAHDLGNSITSDNSRARVAVRRATEQSLLADLETALSPRGLTAPMLELIVEFPEFETRPSLIQPLIRLLLEWESQLATTALVMAARLADRIGRSDLASRWLTRFGYDWLCRNLRSYRYHDALQVTQIMIKYRASLALRALRATRNYHVERDSDERDDSRRQLLADCFDALARPRLAAEMRAPFAPPPKTTAAD